MSAAAKPARPAPFASTEDAWAWALRRITARQRGEPVRPEAGPCEPEDVVRCLDRLYRRRRIELAHARILRIWGERGVAPSPAVPSERGDHRLWTEAMAHLGAMLRRQGIVA